MSRTAAALIFVFCLASCSRSSERSQAENLNDEKFLKEDKQNEADFVIDVLDTSYGLIEVAQMAETRLDNPEQKEKVRKIIQSHTSAMVKIKAYAEKRGITIPFSGPEKMTRSVKKLEGDTTDGFKKSWVNEMLALQEELKSDIERYQNSFRDTALMKVLDNTLMMVETNNEIIISGFEPEKKKSSI